MAEQFSAEQLVQQSPNEILAFDIPRVRVNPGPAATYFQFQRRLQLLAKVPASLLHALEQGRANLQARVVVTATQENCYRLEKE